MDPNDKELKEQLAQDPFARGGFDQRLRQRIKERIDEERDGLRRPRRIDWRLPAAALASFAVILLGIWLWNGPLQSGQSSSGANEPSASAITASPSASVLEQPNKYAVLIGLRTDHNDREIPTSTYRTLLVAPETTDYEQLRLMAEAPGLYMPYKQDFWKIAAVSSADGRQALQAIQATNRKTKKEDAPVHVPDYVLSERVVYAGNEYLSIDSKVKDGQGGSADNWWIKHIGQINSKPDDPRAEPHTVLPDVIAGMDRSQGYADQWSIYRNPGQWVSELYFPSTGDTEKLQELPASVIKNDKLLMSWDNIQKIEPGARDAFTYGNVLGVVTDREIRVHAIRDGAAVSDTVSIPLGKDESIIMIQWAQSGGRIDYVDKWIKEMRSLLGIQP